MNSHRTPHPFENDQLTRTGRSVSIEREKIVIFETRTQEVATTIIDRIPLSLSGMMFSLAGATWLAALGMSNDRQHARLSPSGFKSMEICPSYKRDDKETAAADRGDNLHAMIEAAGYKATELPEFLALEEEKDIYQVQQICNFLEPRETCEGIEIYRELKLDLTSLQIPGCDFGTVDELIVDRKERFAELFDFKFGWLEVDDVEENIQQWIYTCGVFANFYFVDTVRAFILQPGRDELSEAIFTRDDVPRMLLRAWTIAARVDGPKKVYNPVHSNCLWCANKADCPALHALALKGQGLAKLDLPDNLIDLSNPARYGQIYEAMDLIVKWAYAIKDKITEHVKSGSDLQGYHLVSKQGKRSIIDVGLAHDILTQKWGVTEEEFLSLADISITDLEKVIKAKAPRGEKEKLASAVLASLFDEGIVVKGGESKFLAKD